MNHILINTLYTSLHISFATMGQVAYWLQSTFNCPSFTSKLYILRSPKCQHHLPANPSQTFQIYSDPLFLPESHTELNLSPIMKHLVIILEFILLFSSCYPQIINCWGSGSTVTGWNMEWLFNPSWLSCFNNSGASQEMNVSFKDKQYLPSNTCKRQTLSKKLAGQFD